MNNIMCAVSQGDSSKFIHQNWSIPQTNPHTQGEGRGSRHIGPTEGGRKNCLAGVDQIGIESLSHAISEAKYYEFMASIVCQCVLRRIAANSVYINFRGRLVLGKHRIWIKKVWPWMHAIRCGVS